MSRIAGCVVLFNPTEDVLTTIGSYQRQVERLWVIDNSTQKNKHVIAILTQQPTVIYVDNGDNQGVAHALNRAANAAMRAGFDWLLTMDQDSALPPDGVAKLITFTKSLSRLPVGIVTATENPKLRPSDEDGRWVSFVITSGNLLRLSAYRAVGPFLEPLFIDWVDHEFCARLEAAGYWMIELDRVRLTHRLGQSKTLRLGNATVLRWVSHGPERGYYKVRNILFVSTLHKKTLSMTIRWLYAIEVVKVVLKTILLEDQKAYRLRLLGRAVRDGLTQRLGRIDRPVLFWPSSR